MKPQTTELGWLNGDVVCFSLEQIGLLAGHLGVNLDELIDYYHGLKCGLTREESVSVPVERLTAVDNDGTAYPVVLIGADTDNLNRFLSQSEAQQPDTVEPPSGSSDSTTPDTATQPSGPHSDIPCPKISEVTLDADRFLGKEIMILGIYADLYASESCVRVLDLQDDTKYVYVNYSPLPEEEKAMALRRNEAQGRMVIFRGGLRRGRGQTLELLASASFLFLPKPGKEPTTEAKPEARVEKCHQEPTDTVQLETQLGVCHQEVEDDEVDSEAAWDEFWSRPAIQMRVARMNQLYQEISSCGKIVGASGSAMLLGAALGDFAVQPAVINQSYAMQRQQAQAEFHRLRMELEEMGAEFDVPYGAIFYVSNTDYESRDGS